MIYKPAKSPERTIITISLIVLVGILGGIYLSKWIIVASLIYWIQFTLVLSYKQFKKKSKHSYKNLTETLLHPQIRFFLFELIAIFGLIGVIVFDLMVIGISSLLVWLAFSINFYRHYKQFKKYE